MDKKERVALATMVMKKRIAEGLQIPEVAKQMGVSHQTVRDIEGVSRNSTEPIRKKAYQWLGEDLPPAVPRKSRKKRKVYARRAPVPREKSPALAPAGLLERLDKLEKDNLALKAAVFGKVK